MRNFIARNENSGENSGFVGKSKSKGFAKKLLTTSALTAAGLAMLAGGAKADPTHSWHELNQAAGSFDTQTATGSVTNIKLNTARAVGAGNADIYEGHTVNVDGSLFAVKDNRADPTRILGNLNSNGKVLVIDGNGVFFGKNSVVDVQGLIATTGNIENSDIMDGNGVFNIDNDGGTGSIINEGSITVTQAGLAAFVAPTVKNSGVINARLGKVAFAAGEKVTLDLYGDQLVEIAVNEKLADALLENTGEINAEGGQVVMSVEAAKNAVDNVINMDGIINVASATVEGEKIVLSGGEQGNVNVSGTLDASGTNGGSIDVTGENITVAETAEFIADGGKGADGQGNGGRINVIAEKHTDFRGSIFARGGALGGDGGNAEVSGYEILGYTGFADLTAENGALGTLLLDPTFAVIHSGLVNNPLGQNYVLASWALANSMESANIVVQADDFIDVGLRIGGYNTGNAAVDAILNVLVGADDIDLSTYERFAASLGEIISCGGIICSGTTLGGVTFDTDTVNFQKNLIMGDGSVTIAANTVNLDGNLFDKDGTTLLGNGRLSSIADTVNVVSNTASIQQGIYLSNDAGGATVNVADAEFDESIVIDRNLNLVGQPGDVNVPGASSATLKGSGTGTAIMVSEGLTDVTVSGFEIDNFETGIDADNNTADNTIVGGSELDVNNNTFKNVEHAVNVDEWETVNLNLNDVSTGNDGFDIRDFKTVTVTKNILVGGGIADTSENGIITFDEGAADNGTLTVSQNDISNFGEAVDIRNAVTAEIKNNALTGNTDGVNLGSDSDGSLVTIFDNDLSGNMNGVENHSGEVVDASGNWWGSDDETVVEAYMSNVDGGTDFTPFLTQGTDTSTDLGFQGDFTELFVTALGEQTGTKGRIQEGVDLVTNSTVYVGNGTFTGSTIIDKAVTLIGQGVGNTIVTPTAGNAFQVSGNIGGTEMVSFDGFTVEGASGSGITVDSSAILGTLKVTNSYFKDNNISGVSVGGDTAQTNLGHLWIEDTDFLNNGSPGSSAGDGDIFAFRHNNDVTIRNVSIENDSLFGDADYGIQLRGHDLNDLQKTPTDASGTLVLDNVQVAGQYRAGLVGIQGYTSLDLSLTDVTIGGTTAGSTDSVGGFAGLYMERIGAGDLDLSGVTFDLASGDYIDNFTLLDVDARETSFNGVTGKDATIAESFAIEDRVTHKMDFPQIGLVTWRDGDLFVTTNTAGIQNAVDISTAGDNIYVNSGTYDEAVNVWKTVQLYGNNFGTDGNDTRAAESIVTGASPAYTITADNVLIDGFTMDGANLTYGVFLDDVKGTIVQNNIVKGASDAAIGGTIDHHPTAPGTLVVQNNFFEGTNANGIDLYGDAAGKNGSQSIVGADIDILNNVFGSSGDEIDGFGVRFAKVGDANGSIEGAGASGIDSFITIEGNDVYSKGNAVEFSGQVDQATVTISGNNDGFVSSAGNGVVFGGNVTKSTVDLTDNKVDAGLDAVTFDGTVFKGSNVTLTGNTLNAGNDGIAFAQIKGGATVTIGGENASDRNTIVAGADGFEADLGVDGKNTVLTFENNRVSADGAGTSIRDDKNGNSTGVAGGATVNIVDNEFGVTFPDTIGGNAVEFVDALTGVSSVNITGNTIGRSTNYVDGNGIAVLSDGVNAGSGEVNGQTTVTIAANTIRAEEDGIFFGQKISDGATVTIGGTSIDDGNTIFAFGDGVDIDAVDGGTVKINYNKDIRGFQFNSSDAIEIDGALSNGAVVEVKNNANLYGRDDAVDFHSTITDSTVEISGNTKLQGLLDDGIEFDADIAGSTIKIENNDDILGGRNGVNFDGALANTVVSIAGNNAGLFSGLNGIYFGQNISAGSDIDILDNIIVANLNIFDGFGGAGVRFDGDIIDSTVDIGDGSFPESTNRSNIISAWDGVRFDGTVGNGAEIVVDGNRFGFTAPSLTGSLSNARLGDDAIQFNAITGDATVSITENSMRVSGSGVEVNGTIDGTASVVVGGTADNANWINSTGNGASFLGDATGNASVEVSYNDIDVNGNGILFAGNIDNVASGPVSQQEIFLAHNDIDIFSSGNGILVSGDVSKNSHDFRITQNDVFVRDGGNDAVNFTGDVDDASIWIVNNTRLYGDEDGVSFDGALTNNARVRIHGNTDITGEDQDGVDFNGPISGGSFVSVNGNTSISGLDRGVEFSGEYTGNAKIHVKNNTQISAANRDGVLVADATAGGSNVQVTGNLDISAGDNGVELWGTTGALVDNNTIDNTGGDGVEANNAAGVQVTNNMIGTNGGKNNIGADGVDINNSPNANVSDNTILNVVANGVSLNPSAGSKVQGNTISNFGTNGVYVLGSDNVLVGGPNAGDENTISFGQTGVRVADSDGVIVQRNNISELSGGTSNGIGDGVNFNNSDDGQVLANVIFNTSDDGVHFQNGSDNAQIILNEITNVVDSGVSVRSGSQSPFIQDNVIDQAKNGIRVQGTNGTKIDGAEIDDNDITNTTDNAVFVKHVTNASVTDNFIDSKIGDGVRVENSSDVIVGGDNAPNRLTVHNRINNVDKAVVIKNSEDILVGQNEMLSVNYGVHATNVTNLDVEDNTMEGAENAAVGVFVQNSNNVRVGGSESEENRIEDFEYGVQILNSNQLEVSYNQIKNIDFDAIQLDGFDQAWVSWNDIHDTGDDGIEAINGGFVSIYDNYLERIGFFADNADEYGADAIHVRDVFGGPIPVAQGEGVGANQYNAEVEVYNNEAAIVKDDGIEVLDGNSTVIDSNLVGHVGDTGIVVERTDITKISNNIISAAENNGIRVNRGAYAGVFNNRILLTGDEGIEIWNINWNNPSLNFSILGDETYGFGWAVNASGNQLAFIGDHGIYVKNSNPSLIAQNNIFAAGMGEEAMTGLVGTINSFASGSFVPSFARIAEVVEESTPSFGWSWGNGDGIRVENVTGVGPNGTASTVRRNQVRWTGGHGINVFNGETTLIRNNRVRHSGVDYTETAGYDSLLDLVGSGPFASEDRRLLWSPLDMNNDVLRPFVPGPELVEYDGFDNIHVEDIYNNDYTYYNGGYAVRVLNNRAQIAGDDNVEVAYANRTLIENNFLREAGYGNEEAYGSGDYYGADNIHVRGVYDDSYGDYYDGYDYETNEFVGYAVNIIGNDGAISADDGAEVIDSDSVYIAENILTENGVGFIEDEEEVSPYSGADFYGADNIHVRNIRGSSYGYGAGRVISESEFTDYAVVIRDNNASQSGDDGTEVVNAGRTLIKDNVYSNNGFVGAEDGFGGDAIHVRNVFAFNNSPYIESEVSSFNIGATSLDTDGWAVDVRGNRTDGTSDDGIQVLFSGNTRISRNVDIDHSGSLGGQVDQWGADGIHVLGGYFEEGLPFYGPRRKTRQVERAIVSDDSPSYDPAYFLSTKLEVSDNNISDSADDGADIQGITNVLFDNNDITVSGDDGANIVGYAGFALEEEDSDSFVEFGGGSSSELPTFELVMTNNNINNSLGDGAEVTNFDSIDFDGNDITNSTGNGFFAAGPFNGSVAVNNNTFSGNDVSVNLASGAVNMFEGNTYLNGGTAILFSPFNFSNSDLVSATFDVWPASLVPSLPTTGFANLELTDNNPTDIFSGTLGPSFFGFDHTGPLVQLNGDGTLFGPGNPNIYNAVDSTYERADGSTFRPADDANFVISGDDFLYLESKFVHFPDGLLSGLDLGLFLFGIAPDIEESDFLRSLLPFLFGTGPASVTITGALNVPGGPVAANSIETFAGGADLNSEDPETVANALNNIETAAGESTQASCLGDAIGNASQGQVSSFSFGGSAESILAGAAGCSGAF